MEQRIKAISEDRFFLFIIFYIAGTLFSSITSAGFSFSFFLGVLAVNFLLCHFIFRESSQVIFLLFALAFLACSLAGFRFASKDFHTLPAELISKRGTIQMDLVVIDEPKDKGSYIEYVGKSKTFDEKFIIRSERTPRFSYGDNVLFNGNFEKVAPFETETGKLVRYDKILSSRDIYFVLSHATGELVQKNAANSFRGFLFSAKSILLRNIKNHVPEPYATLVAGVVFGSDDTLGSTLDDAFKAAGITHITVLSGYNLAVVASIILAIFTFLPLTPRLIAASIAIVLFALMAGGGASVLRATLMVILMLFAKASGKRYLAGRMLLFAGAVMLFLNPKLLLYDLGFQLSFIATGALIWLSPYVERKLVRIPKRFGIRDVIATSISAHMAVLPLLLFTIGSVSLFGVFANIIVLPVVPILMLLGSVVSVLGFVSNAFLFPFIYITWKIAGFIIFIASAFSEFPFATLGFSIPLVIVLICMYTVFFMWVFPAIKPFFQNKLAKQKRI